MNLNNHLDVLVKKRTESLEEEIKLNTISEKKFRAVTKTANEAIISLDQTDVINYFSKGAEISF